MLKLRTWSQEFGCSVDVLADATTNMEEVAVSLEIVYKALRTGKLFRAELVLPSGVRFILVPSMRDIEG